jgi:hypothetical protein
MFTNKQLVIYSVAGYLVAAVGYAIAPTYGSDSLSDLLVLVGLAGWIVFGVWGWVRLWKTNVEEVVKQG